MSKLKMAIIGAGLWGMSHAHIYDEHPQVEIAAVCDKDIQRAYHLAAQFNVPREGVFSDHQTMIQQSKFDAAAVVTPDFLHKECVVDLANARKDVLVEKPLATSRHDIEEIIEAVERNQIRLMVDLHNRFSPPFAVAKASLDAGEIGEPYSAYFRLNDTKYVATDMLSWAAQSSILWFLGSHSVDTLRWFFNDEVARVFAVSRKGVLSDLGVDVEDIFQTILEFRGGGIATMENSWITPNSHPCINDIKFNITGTKGMINLDLSNNQMIAQFTDEKAFHPDVLVKHFVHGFPAGFAYQSIRHFVDRILDGKAFLLQPLDAVNTSLVILSILESAKKREPVEVRYL